MASLATNFLAQTSTHAFQASTSSRSFPKSEFQGAFSSGNVSSCSSASFFGGASTVCPAKQNVAVQKRHAMLVRAAQAEAEVVDSSDVEARFRLNNLSPAPGSRRKEMRKGRGIAAGQGASCGFGMRGQKSRSGKGVRPGFEGGQMPLYRRLPKLKGIAGGMGAGLPKYVAVNLEQIAELELDDGEEVTLEALKLLGIVKPTGRDRRLPLKILGDGEISSKLTIKAAAFSASAKEKLEAAGCTLEVLPGRKKFLPANVVKKMARQEEFFAKKDAAKDSSS